MSNRSLTNEEIDQLLVVSDEKSIRDLIKVSNQVTEKHWGRDVQCFYPGRLFPSISITGKECAMRCKHCNHRYLETMIPAETPAKLVEISVKLAKEGALGCLISGGFTTGASLPFRNFFPALQEIKRKTKLKINIHIGFMTEDVAKKLVELDIDAVSVDVVGSDETIHNVYGLDKTTKDYTEMLEKAKVIGLKNLDPHICVGVDYGELKGEGKALQMIRDNEPLRLTLIALNPTKGTEMEHAKPPSPLMIAKVVGIARLAMPKISISLGCMRPSGAIRSEIDYLSILAGVNRIVVPTPGALSRLGKEYRFERHQTCCVL
ncbi:MAG: radical SAM protein [Promethearchaeati archaeon SRVP18_Atabeyarchaeia-1]